MSELLLSPLGRAPRRLRVLDAAGVWVVIDQGIASIGNFITGNLLARHLLPQSQYGAWGLILETMFFLNALQSAVVNYPMTIESTAIDRAAPRRAATAALLFTLVMLPVLGLGMFWAAGTTAGFATGAIAVVAMLLWQAQETLRRSLIAVMRVADCIPGDAVSYLGQALGVYLLIRTGHLSLSSALLVVAGTSAAAIVVQAAQTGLTRLSALHLRQLTRRFWTLGRWNLLAALTMVITSLSFPWILRWGSGLDAVAIFIAISVPLKLTNPIMNSIGGLIVPTISRRLREQGPRAAIRPAIHYGTFGLLLQLPCYALAIAAPEFVLRVVFGSGSPYVHAAGALRIWTLYWVAKHLSVVIGAALLGLHQSRLHFVGQTLRAIVVAAVALPAGYFFGVRGLAIGALVSGGADVLMGTFLLRYALRHSANFVAAAHTDAQSPIAIAISRQTGRDDEPDDAPTAADGEQHAAA